MFPSMAGNVVPRPGSCQTGADERGSIGVDRGTEAARPLTGPAQFRALFSSIALPICNIVDQTIVATALPAHGRDGGDVENVSWVVVGYLVAATVAAPFTVGSGVAGGRRRMMFIALGAFASASIICALANSMAMLIAGRILQGLGGGGLMTTAQGLIGETVSPRERPRYQGYIATVVVASSMFGPVAGGF